LLGSRPAGEIMAKRRAKPKPKPGAAAASALLRSEVIGTGLVVLAGFILLSLLSAPANGALTGALVDSMRALTGDGRWLVPVLLGVLGLWLVLRRVSEEPVLSGQRVAAGAVLFFVLEAFGDILSPGPEMGTGGGGLIGHWLSQSLVATLGLPMAVVLLFLAGLLALGGVAGLTWPKLQERASAAWQRLRGQAGEPETLRVNPPLPLGHVESPLRRWLRRWPGGFFRPAGDGRLPQRTGDRLPIPALQPPPFVVGRSTLTAGNRPESAARSSQSAPGNPPLSGGSSGASPAEVTPRIIGSGGQTWRLPALADILEDSSELDIQSDDLRQRAEVIEKTLEGFGLPVQVVEANQGPAVTQFGLRPGMIVRRNRKGEEKRVKVRVSQIQALSNDLALALAASPLRIEAPVPGRDVVGVEVPNVQISLVALRGVMESEEFRQARGPMIFGLGRDVSGQSVVADLARMPHLLIAGATGSGKSVCVNAIITTLLMTHTPESLRFLMVDPKRVELTVYNGIPHLIAPVVVDVERAVPVLQWATREMDRRYKLFAKLSARNIESYNEKLAARGEPLLPFIVILIDELADLMLSAPEDVERYICRIAQMARATGIHLVIATQRPSVDVVTGLIKANFPARIAFAVTSQIDSRVILDAPGAEQLLGRGDMLFMAPDASKLQRLQGCFVSDRETQRLVRYWKGVHSLDAEPEQPSIDDMGGEPALGEMLPAPGAAPAPGTSSGKSVPGASVPEPPWIPGQESLQQPLWSDMAGMDESGADGDQMYRQAVEEVRKAGKASVSLLQRRLRIGYSRAARLIDELETRGVIGPDLGGSRGREVLPAADEGQDQGEDE
jgi:DNA segregation ATPase FtsK/SpoIIIE, S-DNA-T family